MNPSPPLHAPQHRGCIQFLNKSMQRAYYVQKTYYMVINTDLIPAHTAHSPTEETDVNQRIIQIHNSDIYLSSVVRATKGKLGSGL